MFLECSLLVTSNLQIDQITNVFPGTMSVPSQVHLGCTPDVPAMFLAVYLGRYISTQSQLTMLVLMLGLMLMLGCSGDCSYS